MARPASQRASTPFGRVFTAHAVRSIAGSRSFGRGELYAASGRVRKLRASSDAADASVQGTSVYKVRLWVDDDTPGFNCTCPIGMDGGFCKHCVAVALVAAGADDDAVTAGDERTVDLRAHLDGLDHSRLVDVLLELSDNDELLRARLQLDAARSSRQPAPRQLQQLKRAIDDVFVTGDYVSWREAYAYADNIQTTLDTLRTLLREGHAATVIELAEHALSRLEEAVGYVDDSDGQLGSIAEDLQRLHLDACKKARPEPLELAARLFEWERDAGDLDIFSRAAVAYAYVLGKAGLAEYRRLAEAEWARLPVLGPGDKRSYEGTRFRITHMMEGLADASGDIDAVVAVLAKDQSSAWQFVRIAEKLREHGRFIDALMWAERGLKAFGACADPRLVEVLSDEYHRGGRGANAVALAWRVLDESPSPVAYQRLAEQARRAKVWEAWRLRALDRLRADLERRKSARGASGSGRPPLAHWAPVADASALVEVFLWEGDVERAWAEAQAGGCSGALWLELAKRRERDHPGDAIPIWQAAVERSIELKKNDGYTKAVEIMAHVAKLMRAAAQAESFAPYAADVRTRHRAKRNLVKLLDARRW